MTSAFESQVLRALKAASFQGRLLGPIEVVGNDHRAHVQVDNVVLVFEMDHGSAQMVRLRIGGLEWSSEEVLAALNYGPSNVIASRQLPIWSKQLEMIATYFASLSEVLDRVGEHEFLAKLSAAREKKLATGDFRVATDEERAIFRKIQELAKRRLPFFRRRP